MAEAIDLCNQEVHVLVLSSRIGDDVAEEVGNIAKRLVADHESSCVHHSAFQQRRDLRSSQTLKQKVTLSLVT